MSRCKAWDNMCWAHFKRYHPAQAAPAIQKQRSQHTRCSSCNSARLAQTSVGRERCCRWCARNLDKADQTCLLCFSALDAPALQKCCSSCRNKSCVCASCNQFASNLPCVRCYLRRTNFKFCLLCDSMPLLAPGLVPELGRMCKRCHATLTQHLCVGCGSSQTTLHRCATLTSSGAQCPNHVYQCSNCFSVVGRAVCLLCSFNLPADSFCWRCGRPRASSIEKNQVHD